MQKESHSSEPVAHLTPATPISSTQRTRSASARLRKNKETILQLWEEQVRRDLPTAHSENTLVLRNALPVFLDTLARTLDITTPIPCPAETAEVGREHGQQRATLTEYSLKAMLREYSHLRKIIIEVLGSEDRLTVKEEAIIHRTIDDAIAEAGAEFARIQSFNQKLYVDNLEMERELREGFVNTLTHDLRNPLSAAHTSAQLILKRPEQLETVQKFAGRIVDSIQRADRMIRDLLDVNLIKAGQHLPLKVEHVNLNDIAKAALDELASIHGNRFDLVSEKPVMGYWCPEGLRRSIENLANNSVKYGYPNTAITTTLSQNNETVLIHVHNHGKSLSDEDQLSLFKAFKRTASAQASGKRGWGIGLTIVKGVSETHGGSVRVKSSAADGTTFTIELPNDARPFEQAINKAP